MEPLEDNKPAKQNYFVFLWKHLSAGQKWGISALLLLLLVFPIAIIAALMPTNPFSKAGGPPPPSIPVGATSVLTFFPSPDDPPLEVYPNQQFTVELLLDSQLNVISAAKIRLQYPASIGINLESVELSDSLPTILEEPVINSNNGLVSFTIGSTAEDPVQGLFTLAILHFKANSSNTETEGPLNYTGESEIAAIGEDGNVLNFSRTLTIKKIAAPPDNADLAIKFKLETVSAKANDLPLTATLEMQNCNPCVTIPKDVIATNDDTGTYTATISGISLGNNNEYKVFVKPEGFLKKALGVITLIPGYNLITGDPNGSGLSLTPGDLNNNGEVDIYDFTTVIEDYGSTNSPADFNKNGIVDIYDFTSVVEFYGSTGD